MENTLENKAKFYALHWGQEVIKDVISGVGYPVEGSNISLNIETSFLHLKPLSSISDEDKEHLDALLSADFDEYGYWFGMGGIHYYQPHEVDYLRSRGYALPWMELSVEKLMEYGWIKLKED